MTGTPKEIADWFGFDTFKPLTKSGQMHLLWMLKEGDIHPKPIPLARDGVLVGYEVPLPRRLDRRRFALVGLKQDEEDGKIDFMAASINYKSWKDFLKAAEYSSFSGTAVAQCEKRMWTSEVKINLEVLHERVEKLKNSKPALRSPLKFHEQRRYLPFEWNFDVGESHWHLESVVKDRLPGTQIFSIPEKLTDLCDDLPLHDCGEIYGQLRRLRFVGGAHVVSANSKRSGFTYFVWDRDTPLTFFWYKKSGEEGWVREVRRKNHQSKQYEYAVQKLKTIKVDEPIPQTFEDSGESLILSQIPLNEGDNGKVQAWLLPPISDNEPETESTADVSESDSFSDTKGSKRWRLL